MSNTTVVALDDGEGSGRCELLGPFALFVQGALGALALLALVWKRARERPQRPLRIWSMDVSKQVFGAIFVHIANLLLSMLSSGSFSTDPTPLSIPRLRRRDDEEDDPNYHSNPCSFYLLNLAIDTTLGVVILIYVLRGIHYLLQFSPCAALKTGISSGYYGDPPKWSYWAKQAIIYFCGLMTMKLCVWVIFAMFPWLGRVGDWLLAWTEGNRQLQVFFVMFFFPLVMNAFQYYVIDSFIKAPTEPEAINLPPNDPTGGSFSSRSSSSGDDVSRPLNSRRRSSRSTRSTRASRKSHVSHAMAEYDPAVDGTQSPKEEEAEGSVAGESSESERKGGSLRPPTVKSTRSQNSSMMLLPGSRGPSTPGYEEDSIQGRRGFGDDESTLVDDKASSNEGR